MRLKECRGVSITVGQSRTRQSALPTPQTKIPQAAVHTPLHCSTRVHDTDLTASPATADDADTPFSSLHSHCLQTKPPILFSYRPTRAACLDTESLIFFSSAADGHSNTDTVHSPQTPPPILFSSALDADPVLVCPRRRSSSRLPSTPTPSTVHRRRRRRSSSPLLPTPIHFSSAADADPQVQYMELSGQSDASGDNEESGDNDDKDDGNGGCNDNDETFDGVPHFAAKRYQMPEQYKKRRVSFHREANSFLPILHSSDYYIRPSLNKLVSRELKDAGYCRRVPNFIVGRAGFGQINFFGETDVRLLDLERIVKFSRHSVLVYEIESDKPPVGHGLNKAAEVTLLLKSRDVQAVELQKFVGKLRRCNEKQGASFVSFNLLSGEWKFLVRHFSRFGLDEDEDEEEDAFIDDNVVQQDKDIEGSGGYSDGVALSHSLPAHLGLDPMKMHEMRMLMFPDEDEEEDLNAPFSQKKYLATDYVRADSPSSNAKRSIHRSPLQNSTRKAINKVSPLQRAPQALLEYHASNRDISPSQNILMTRQNKALPPRTLKVEGFKLDSKHSTPFDGCLSSNVVDSALFMGRSFRVGWGPNGVLVHSGSPVGNPGNGLSSVINIERVAVDRVVRDKENKIKEELVDLCFASPLNLHKSLDHETAEIQVSSFTIKLQKVVASPFILSEVCRDYMGIIEKQLEVSDLPLASRLVMMHQVTIWELIKVLFSKREVDERLRPPSVVVDDDGEEMMLDKGDFSLDIDPEARSYMCRADFSLWLQDCVCHRVQEELSCLNGSGDLEHILLLLTGRQLDAAVELAASRGDVRLAILMSHCGGSMINRNDMARQLDLWRNNGLDFNFVEKERLRIYELLAGNIEGAFSDYLVDWKRYLGLVMWFQLPPDTPLPVIVHTYNHLLSEGRAPHPVPVYVDEGLPDETVNWSEGDRYDLAYYLMLLHANKENPFGCIKTMFSAFASTHDPLDYHMIWQQRGVLEAIGAFSSDDLHLLDMSFISQLLSLGQCHWAIYIALHMPYREDFPNAQANVVKEILYQYCELWSAEKLQWQFIEDLGVPREWMHEALAIYFQYYGDLHKALEHFLECSNWQKAHSIFMKSVAHSLFLSSRHSEIRRLTNSMESYKMEIANWDLGAGIFVDYYDLESYLQEEMSMGKQDTLEKMSDACKSFFNRLNKALLVWGSKLPIHARAAYSKMVEQLSRLLVSIPGGSTSVQMSCYDAILGAPIPEDLQSCHLQDAVSVFTFFISEGTA